MHDPEDEIVDPQPYQADRQEFGVFQGDVRVLALEGPDPVQDIVGRCSDREPDGIGHIFLDLQPFLADIGYAKIYGDTREADNAELYEFQDKGPGEEIVHIRAV
jgi:hypothetical protein